MNKLFEKMLSVVAAVAICCVMTVPMTAEAAVCTHDTMMMGGVQTGSSSYTHPFSYYLDVDGDGDLEIVTDTCTVTVATYAQANICPTCGYTSIISGTEWTVTTHSAAGNPYHN